MQKSSKNKKIKWICTSVIASIFLISTIFLTTFHSNILVPSLDANNSTSLQQAQNINTNEKITEKQESLSLVQPLNQPTNRSRDFKEISFNKDGQKFFSLVYENNGLFFKTLGDDTLLATANLNSNKANENNINTLDGVAFGTNILSIEKISLTDNGANSTIATSLNTNFDTSPEAPTFITNGRNSYFKSGTNRNIDLGLENNNTFMVRFYLNGPSGALSMTYDDGNGNIIDQNSITNLKESINMLSNSTSIAIEGWITKTPNGVSFSFAKPDGGGSDNNILGSTNSGIFDSLKDKRAEEALNDVSNGDPTNPTGITWSQYFRGLILNGFNDAQILLSSFKATADSSIGNIKVEIYNPISTQTTTPTSGLQHYIYSRSSPPPLIWETITGFNTGTILLKNDFQTTINAIPEYAIDDRVHLLDIYKMITEEGFGPDNLLAVFDYRNDMKLENIVVDNLNATLNAELVILNNYRETDGTEITNKVSKNFGKISISNFSTIAATKVKNDEINLPINSPLASQIPSEAINNEGDLLNLVFDNRALILDNLPNDTNTSRNVLISDFRITVVLANNSRGTILLNVELNYYFNSILGIYKNDTPFEFDLTIAGFVKTKETVIDTSKTYVLDATNDVYPQNYINTPNINSIIQNYIYENTNDKLFIIDNAPLKGTTNGFNVNDIFIRDIMPMNLKGEVEVTFTILKWFDQTGVINNTPFPTDQKIIFSNFKKAEATFINTHNANKPFLFDNPTLSPTEFLALGDSETKIKQFILDNAFNISTQNIITGTLPTNNFGLDNIHIISTKPVDLQGQIEIEFAINSYILGNGNIISNGNFDLRSPKIKIAGFNVVEETRLLSNRFLAPETEQNNPAVVFTSVKVKQFLISQLLDNKLLNSYPLSIFNPENDLDVRDYSFNNIIGEVYINLYVKNYYDANGVVVSAFKSLGKITIYGFNQLKVTTIENDKSFSIANTIYQEKYVDQLVENDIRDIIEMFTKKNQLIVNAPNNFDFINNINNITFIPNKFESNIAVKFSINYYYNDQGIVTSNPELEGNIILSGFLIPPITKLNDNIYDFNTVTEYRIQTKHNEPLNAQQILEYVNIYGFEDIIIHGKIIGKPLVKIDNPRNTNQQLELIFNENSLKINVDGSLSFTCTFTGGYYFYDSIPIEIENPTQIRTFTIYNLGVLTDSSIAAPTTIGIIVAGSVVGLIVMFILTYLIRKRMVVRSSYGDKYDDEDPMDKLTF